MLKDCGVVAGHLESIEWPRRGSGRCPGGQAEMSEDLLVGGLLLCKPILITLVLFALYGHLERLPLAAHRHDQ